MNRPLVSLCMIVKNEEENLPGCLKSIHGLVDEIIVVDTGSEDRTAALAESFGAKVFSISWKDDFAAARNESISRASGDWIIYLDADERLVSNGIQDCLRVAAVTPGVDAWSVGIRSFKHNTKAYDITNNIRLFRRLPEVLFENEVHERIEPALARLGANIQVAPFLIDHFGYELSPDAMKRKLERNLELSKKHLSRQPGDPYCLYYLGITLLQLCRYEESRVYLQRALESGETPLYLKAMVCNLIAYLNILEGNPDEALIFAVKSRELVPNQNTSDLLCGLALFYKAEFSAALPLLTRAREFLRLPLGKRPSELSQEFALIDDEEFVRLIALCNAKTGRFAEAAGYYRQYMQMREPDSATLNYAGICCINSGDFVAGLEMLERAVQSGADPAELALPMAYACAQLKDLDRTKSLLEKARMNPDRDSELESRVENVLRNELNKSCKVARKGRSPRISLCMIVKNEELRLPECLESVRGAVDEIVIVDTGSTDKTVEVAKSLGAKVFHDTWKDDFSKARNESIRNATGDWVLFLDADERLNCLGDEDCLRKSASAPELDAFLVSINNWAANGNPEPTIGTAIRFFRRIPGIHFSGRVHEGVDDFLTAVNAKTSKAKFAVDHFGYAQEESVLAEKYHRNLNLLRKELAERPDNPNARYHLGLTFVALKEEQQAREAFDLALQGHGLSASLEAMILNMKSYHHLRAGEIDQSLVASSRSLSRVPVQNTARLLRGVALFQKKAFDEALPDLLESYKFITLPPQERKSDIHYEDSIERSDLIEIIGTCFSETGRFKEAVPFLKMTAVLKPKPAVLERLGICLLNSGDFRGAAHNLEKALASGLPDPLSIALPLSFAKLRTGDFSAAADYFCRAQPRESSEITVAFQLLEAMAGENGFRPYLAACILSKQALFREAFPDRFPAITAMTGALTGEPVFVQQTVSCELEV